jgi:hypothetical protein
LRLKLKTTSQIHTSSKSTMQLSKTIFLDSDVFI